MKLTTKGRYGIHAMYELARCARDGQDTPVSLKAIAERQDIPEAYLEQLFALLKKAGLVRSTRGAQGGYTLARPASDISVGEVLRTLEGGLNVVDCLDDSGMCGKSCECPTRIVWKKLTDGINRIVDSITLDDMIDDYERQCAREDDGK